MLFQFSHPRPIEAQPLGPLRPSPGAPVLWAVQPTSQRPRTPRLHCQPPSNPGLTHHSEAQPGTPPQKALATRPQGCLGRPRTTRSLSPNFAVQGSSGHQLWAPRSIWIEETVEGTEPVERPEMDKTVTPTRTLTPRAPRGARVTEVIWNRIFPPRHPYNLGLHKSSLWGALCLVECL